MSTYRKEWPCCGDVSETNAWEPETCPFCATPPQANAEEYAASVRRCDLHHLYSCAQCYSTPPQANAQGSADYVLVPLVPTDPMWSGLARDIMMWMDLEGRKTPRSLFTHLERCGQEIPRWLRDEHEMKNLDHVPSKGTRAVLIYRAMIAAAPQATSATHQPAEQDVRALLNEMVALKTTVAWYESGDAQYLIRLRHDIEQKVADLKNGDDGIRAVERALKGEWK